MPVMIRWFADGVDPDYGLLDFRRLSERLGDTPVVPADAARLVRRRREPHARAVGVAVRRRAHGVDSGIGGVARRSRRSCDRGRASPCRRRRARSRPGTRRSRTRCARCGRSAAASCCAWRWGRSSAPSRSRRSPKHSRRSPRSRSRRRCGPSAGSSCRRRTRGLDFSVIAMGRFGGGELGFGSDADVMYVYRAERRRPAACASSSPTQLVAGLRKHSEDHRVPLDLDADLRPEGRNGPIARSLDAYAEYYRRWSLSWEAQALLRARGVAGSVKLIRAFTALGRRRAVPGIRRSAGNPRDQAHQGARRERATAAGHRSGTPPEARTRVAQRRGVARAAAAARARPCRARHADDLDDERAARGDRMPGSLPPPSADRLAAGVASCEPPSLGEHAAVGSDERRPARPTASGSTESGVCWSTRLARPRRSRRTTSPRPVVRGACSRSSSTGEARGLHTLVTSAKPQRGSPRLA